MRRHSGHIDGDVAIGGNVAMGGDATIQGSVRIGHDLRVDGWLEAKNIKGSCKGLFLSEERLKQSYPRPQRGWWALVGKTLPADIYVSEGGEWVPTGEQGGEPNLDLSDFWSRVEEIATEHESQGKEIEKIYGTGRVVTGLGAGDADETSVRISVLKKKIGDETTYASELEIGAATPEHAGVMTSAQAAKLERLKENTGGDRPTNNNNNGIGGRVLPFRFVESLNDDDMTYVEERYACEDELIHWIHANDWDDITCHVDGTADTLYLYLYVESNDEWFYADEWGEIPNLGIASSLSYHDKGMLLIDEQDGCLYRNGNNGLVRFVDESDKGSTGVSEGVPTSYFGGVDRVPGAVIQNGRAGENYAVVWLDNSATPDDATYKAASTDEPLMNGRFAARVLRVTARSASGVADDTAVGGSTIGGTTGGGSSETVSEYFDDWEGKTEFCDAQGRPKVRHIYIDAITGSQYLGKGMQLMCIAMGPHRAKRALFADLWNAMFHEDSETGYYDSVRDEFVLGERRLSYGEAVAEYVRRRGGIAGVDSINEYTDAEISAIIKDYYAETGDESFSVEELVVEFTDVEIDAIIAEMEAEEERDPNTSEEERGEATTEEDLNKP